MGGQGGYHWSDHAVRCTFHLPAKVVLKARADSLEKTLHEERTKLSKYETEGEGKEAELAEKEEVRVSLNNMSNLGSCWDTAIFLKSPTSSFRELPAII